MKIGIIGGGSLGLLFSTYLSRNYEVTLYTRTATQSDLIERNGIRLVQAETEVNFKVSALPIEQISSEEAVLIICVKEYHLKEVLPFLKNINCPLLFLQNGMAHLSILPEMPQSHIGLGITEHGALKINGNTVKHTGIGLTRIAPFRGSISFFDLKGDDHLFRFVLEKDYYDMMLKKLIVNACINPLTAVLGAANGQLLENPFYYSLFQALLKEVLEVFGISDKLKLQRYIEQICRKTANNKSSMLRDIEEKRMTEVDAILGYVLVQAQSRKIEPALAKYLYTMIKGKEYHGEETDCPK